jgi:2-dehydro-3-deoxygluconokinase
VPGLYAISLDATGERSFTYWRDTSAARTLFLPPAEVTPERLAGFDLIYLSGITLAVLTPEARATLAAFLPGYRRQGGLVSFDSNYRPRLWSDVATAREAIAAFWAQTDVGLPSLDDEMALWGDPDADAVLARLRAAGVARGALKRGGEGPLPIGPAGPLPGFAQAERVVDTTAAGDSFNGAYLAALLTGAPEADCLAAGHATAAKVIGHPGAIIPRDA